MGSFTPGDAADGAAERRNRNSTDAGKAETTPFSPRARVVVVLLCVSSGVHCLPEVISLPKCLIDTAVTVDNDICDGQALRVACLRVEPVDGLILAQSAQADQTIDACLGAGIHNDDKVEGVEIRVSRSLDEERNVVDNDRMGLAIRLFHPQATELTDCGVSDRVESKSRVSIRENDRAESRPIERAIWRDHTRSESFGDQCECRGAWLDDLPGEFVCVDNHCTAAGEPLRDSAFA